MRELRGPRAVQSVKQYNFISEFRDLCIKAENFDYEDEGCVSRWKSLIFLLPFTVEFHEKNVKIVMIWVTQKLRRQDEQGFSSFFANFFYIYLLTFYCEVVHWKYKKNLQKCKKTLLDFWAYENPILGTQSVSKSKVLVSKFFKHFVVCYDFTKIHKKTCSSVFQFTLGLVFILA